MPPFGGARPLVVLHGERLFLGRGFRRIFWIKAHGQNVELISSVEAEGAQRSFKSSQDFAAKHRTAVIHQTKNHRFLTEIVAKLNGLAAFVAKLQIEWKLLI